MLKYLALDNATIWRSARDKLTSLISEVELKRLGWRICDRDVDAHELFINDARIQKTHTSYRGISLIQRDFDNDDAIWLKNWELWDTDGIVMLVHDWTEAGWERPIEFQSMSECVSFIRNDYNDVCG